MTTRVMTADERNRTRARERNRKLLMKLLDAQTHFARALDKHLADEIDREEFERARGPRDAAYDKVLARMKQEDYR